MRNPNGTVPQVSVIMPVYNAAATVMRAIDSALDQGAVSVEVVVVDDCSKDDCVALIGTAYGGDARVRLLSTGRNQGPAHARNLAIREARGEWVALLDSDDKWLPGRLAALLGAADEADFVADQLLGYDAVAEEITGPFFHGAVPSGRLGFAAFAAPSPRYDCGYLKPMMHRAFLLEHDLLYREDLRHGEDFMLYAQALCLGARFVVIPEALYIYTTPVGRSSGAASPHSNTQYDDSRLREAVAGLAATFARTLSEADRRALAQKQSMLAIARDYLEFLARARRRDVLGALQIAWRKPAVVSLTLKNLTGRLRARVGA